MGERVGVGGLHHEGLPVARKRARAAPPRTEIIFLLRASLALSSMGS